MKAIALLLLALLLAGSAQGQVPLVYPGPQGASVPVQASATGTTSGASISLPAVTGKTTYICGFVVTSAGNTSAAPVVNVPIVGPANTLNFTYIYVSSGQGLLGVAFPQCIPAAAQNTAITINVPASTGTTLTVVAVSAWGYQN